MSYLTVDIYFILRKENIININSYNLRVDHFKVITFVKTKLIACKAILVYVLINKSKKKNYKETLSNSLQCLLCYLIIKPIISKKL